MSLYPSDSGQMAYVFDINILQCTNTMT